MRSIKPFLVPFGFVSILPSVLIAGEQQLAVMDLEALMTMDVQATSVMKRVESVKDTAASIYVLTEDQIRLSGVNTLTEAVGLLPGIYFRQQNNNQVAVGIRQLPDSLSSGFLVMIDGKYVYNPIFPGTIWEHLAIPLTNIDRIELIRGSAGTLWSSKASNGVINIITKHSIDTQGFEVVTAAGTMEQAAGGFRYGGLFGDGGSFRFNLASRQIGESGDFAQPAHDAHQLDTFNTRIDYTFSDDLSLIFKLNYLNSNSDVTFNQVSSVTNQATPVETDYDADKVNMVMRLDHRISASQTQQVQLNYADGSAEVGTLEGDLQILNLNYSMNTELINHKLDWGLEYQLNKASAEESDVFKVAGDNDSRLENYGFFIQDEFSFNETRTALVSGLRIDKDPLTDWEFQPSLRLMHLLDGQQRIWAGLSRSVMTPTDYAQRVSLLQHSVVSLPSPPFPPGIQVPTYISGSTDFDTEEYDNFELGYRGQFDAAEIDLSLFYTTSDNAVALQPDSTTIPGEIHNIAVNEGEYSRRGGELVVNLQPRYNWSVQLSVSYVRVDSQVGPGLIALFTDNAEQKQLAIRSDYRHSEALSSYLRLHYQSAFPVTQVPTITTEKVPEHVSLDAGITWRASDELELGLYGRNLFSSHPEFPSNQLSQSYTTEIEPSVTARAVWAF